MFQARAIYSIFQHTKKLLIKWLKSKFEDSIINVNLNDSKILNILGLFFSRRCTMGVGPFWSRIWIFESSSFWSLGEYNMELSRRWPVLEWAILYIMYGKMNLPLHNACQTSFPIITSVTSWTIVNCALEYNWHNKQQSKVQSNRCKIPTDGVPFSSNQSIFGIPGQTKLMQI